MPVLDLDPVSCNRHLSTFSYILTCMLGKRVRCNNHMDETVIQMPPFTSRVTFVLKENV